MEGMAECRRAEEVIAELDADQRAVATFLGEPLVVLAGAGSGKTRAITHRIAYAAWSGQMNPRRTLAVTFTTRAAGELRDRLAALGVPHVQARTFHAAALRQLRYFWPRIYGKPLPEVAPSTLGLVAEATRPLGIEIDTPLLRDLAAEVSWAKVSNVTPEDYPVIAPAQGRMIATLGSAQVAGILERYEYVKRHRECIDFDDILLCAVALLHQHGEVAEEIRDQYRHLTVDEYQDVSPVQQSLLDLWLGAGRDVCVVGDQNQAIHGFAGADPDFLVTFAARHRATTMRLGTNYRSTPQVISVANTLLPPGQRLKPCRESGPRVVITSAIDDQDEISCLAGWLQARHQEGLAWEEMAVLYRINAQAQPLAEVLSGLGIPHWVKENRPGPARLVEQTAAGGGVVLSTMHAAKGLEWQAVGVIGLSEGLVPFSTAHSTAQLAEEKRLLYVAMTRAKTYLHLSWARTTPSGRDRQPSRFLAVEDDVRRATVSRPSGRRSRTSTLCWVCHHGLVDPAEIKLGHHLACQVDLDRGLYQTLIDWRSRVAAEQSMPAFVICTDATLRAIAERKPTDLLELSLIRGIGRTKTREFGEEIMSIIAGYR